VCAAQVVQPDASVFEQLYGIWQRGEYPYIYPDRRGQAGDDDQWPYPNHPNPSPNHHLATSGHKRVTQCTRRHGIPASVYTLTTLVLCAWYRWLLLVITTYLLTYLLTRFLTCSLAHLLT
jgi:hypothetical protein